MFGSQKNPLDRSQLKWLLVVLAVILMGVVVAAALMLAKEISQAPSGEDMKKPLAGTSLTSEEKVREQLEKLREMNGGTASNQLTEEEVRKQLEKLRETNGGTASSPTAEEEVREQLEKLREMK